MPILEENKIEEFTAQAMPHLDEIFRTASRIKKNRSEAENLVEKVYFQALETYPYLEPETDCRFLLFKILFSKFEFENDGGAVFQNPVVEPEAAGTLSDAEILSTLKYIPLKFREPLLLDYMNEFSYKEIGEILDIPMKRLGRESVGAENY